MNGKCVRQFVVFFMVGIHSAFAVPGDQNWDNRFGLAPGFNGPIRAMAVAGTNLYVAGDFTSIGGLQANGIARWDGSTWHELGGIVGLPMALATDGTNVFVGGRFSQAGNIAVTNIACWNGEEWSALGAGLATQQGGLSFMEMDGTTLLEIPGGVETLLWQSSKLYAGGNFFRAGDLPVTNIAVWNGLQWESLGDGLEGRDSGYGPPIGTIKALAFRGTNLYAGGYFETSGSNQVTNIAVWDGIQWSPVGGGITTTNEYFIFAEHVSTLAWSGERLLVGGLFSRAGEIVATNLACWNGAEWSAINAEATARPNGLLIEGQDAILFGKFASVGGVNSSGIARFNGTNWFGFGRGVVGEAKGGVKFGTNLYIGGKFQIAGGNSAGFIARWDGQEWQSLFSGTGGALLGETVNSMAADSRGVYVTGKLISAGQTPVASVAHFNGTNWIAMDEGLSPGRMHFVSIVQTNLYLVEQSIYGNPELRRWSGTAWDLIDDTLTNATYFSSDATSLAASETDLYIAGNFTSTAAVAATNLARWDGAQWQSLNHKPLRDDPFLEISAMATRGKSLFIAEHGDELPPLPLSTNSTPATNAISWWDGTNWTCISSNFLFADQYNSFQAMTCFGSNLFVAGRFVVTNPIIATNFLRWDGKAWDAVDFPFRSDAQIFSMAANETNLYARGWFPETDGSSYAGIAKWDGISWSMLGSGVYSETYGLFEVAGSNDKIVTTGRDVYVSGGFTAAGGKSSYQFALWHEFPSISLASRGRLDNGRFGLSILGGLGQSVRVQVSSDLNAWSDLEIKTPDSDPFSFEDEMGTTNSNRFYRLLLLP